MHFLLDANMPRAAVEVVLAARHQCTHVRDTPLANAPDAAIAEFAKCGRLTLVTRDFDFADVRRYPPEQFAGIAVLVVPDTASASVLARLLAAFLTQSECVASLPGRLAIVEFGRVRIRPAPPTSES